MRGEAGFWAKKSGWEFGNVRQSVSKCEKFGKTEKKVWNCARISV